MEVLEIDGKKYVKAAVAARDLGYTSDYVGQLCRAGKIDAHLVGRSWYVDQESMQAHKSDKHRSSKTKSRKALQQELQERAKERHVAVKASASDTASASHHFYSKLSPKKVKYDEDRSELIPTLSERKTSESRKLDVRIAGAEKLDVEKETEPYALTATERPQIRFSGELDVTAAKADPEPMQTMQEEETTADAEDATVQEASEKEENVATKPEVAKSSSEARPKRADLQLETEGADEQKLPVKRKGVIAMTRKSQESIAENEAAELTIAAVKPHRRRSARATFVYVASSVVLALAVTFGTLLVDHSISSHSDSEQLKAGYSLNMDNVARAINSLK